MITNEDVNSLLHHLYEKRTELVVTESRRKAEDPSAQPAIDALERAHDLLLVQLSHVDGVLESYYSQVRAHKEQFERAHAAVQDYADDYDHEGFGSEEESALHVRIRDLMDSHHMSLNELSETSGLSQRTLARLLQGLSNPQARTLRALEFAFGFEDGELDG